MTVGPIPLARSSYEIRIPTGVSLSRPRPICPKCGRPLRELGLRFSGGRIVPRSIYDLRGVQIQGDFLGVDYACLDCELTVYHPARTGPAAGP